MPSDVPEIIKEGAMELHLYQVDNGWVAADRAGWLAGVWDTRDEAIAAARKANGL